MGRTHDSITDGIKKFIEEQKLFFVATAPNSLDAHINLSPKGLDAFRIIDDRTAAYLDHTGSGAETIAHVRENGRIVLMFCAFEGPPRIVRLHGRGEFLLPENPGFSGLRSLFSEPVPVRAIIRIAVERVSESCGFGVPLYRFEGNRTELTDWAVKKGETGLRDYQREKNRISIDGLPALDFE